MAVPHPSGLLTEQVSFWALLWFCVITLKGTAKALAVDLSRLDILSFTKTAFFKTWKVRRAPTSVSYGSLLPTDLRVSYHLDILDIKSVRWYHTQTGGLPITLTPFIIKSVSWYHPRTGGLAIALTSFDIESVSWYHPQTGGLAIALTSFDIKSVRWYHRLTWSLQVCFGLTGLSKILILVRTNSPNMPPKNLA